MAGEASRLLVSGLGHNYGKHSVFRDITFTAAPGVLGLLGPNGAGKTTLIRQLAGTEPIRQGEAVLVSDGANILPLRNLRREIGYMPQTLGYFPNFSAGEFVEYVGWLRKVPGARRRHQAKQALRHVDLEGEYETKMGKLSGGMRQRVGLACALVNRPRLLLLDEPTVGLDVEQRMTFRRLLSTMKSPPITILSSHLPDDVAAVCDRVMVLSAGRLVFDGDIERMTGRKSATPADVESAYLQLIHSR